jgi:DNA polymerase I-like protein with 3'-5' exonuclease and polymerase domains
VKHGRRSGDEKGLAPHRMPPEEVTLYNAADCRLDIVGWRNCQADLEAERHIYEHDKELSVICQRMTMDGIYYDYPRLREIRRAMSQKAVALKARMRKLVRRESFNPRATADVRWALFDRLKAPVFAPTSTGLPSTSAATLESLKSSDTPAGELAKLLLEWRVVDKVRGTYVDAIAEMINDKTGRVHYTWRPYGTVSGRWSCRFQSLPRGGPQPEDRIGEAVAPQGDSEFWYFDLSQSEMRAAAYISGDDNFIATCESGDVHAGNAGILFPQALADGWLRGGPKCERCKAEEVEIQAGRKVAGHGMDVCSNPKGNWKLGKKFRDIAKNAGFGILYSAEIDTIFEFLRSKGFRVKRAQVEAMFAAVHEKYSVYYDFCEDNLIDCRANGWMRTVLMGRIRWFGIYPKPGDIYNYPIQSFIADLMNLRLIELRKRLPAKVKIVAQIHDALVLEAKRGKDSRVTGELIREVWSAPIELPNGRNFVMPIDLKSGDRLSQFR